MRGPWYLHPSLQALLGVLVLAATAAAEPYVLQPGDTLWEIARTRYGDPTFWRELKSVNGIANPRTIPNGTKIWLPTPDQIRRYRQATDPAERERIRREVTGGRAAQPSGSPTPAAGPETQVVADPVEGLAAPAQVPSKSP